jgi:putative glutathione S-transferase
MTTVRFDEVYVGHFKCNKARMVDYPNIKNFNREIFQYPGVGETIFMDKIKSHYYGSHKTINPFGLVPIGPNAMADFALPHDRDEKFPIAK